MSDKRPPDERAPEAEAEAEPPETTLAQEVATLGEPPPARKGQKRSWAGRLWSLAAVPIAAVVLALVVGAVIITLSSPVITGSLDLTLWIEAYTALLEGGLGIGSNNPQNALTRTITNSAPLLLAGLSVALGFKAGLFNIGANGQVIIGGLSAAIVGAAVATWSPFLAIPAAVVAGAAASFFYGFIPGFLKATTGAHEVVTTIMLNFIAGFIGSALVINIFRAPGYTFDRTAEILNSALPVIFGRDLHLGVLVAYAFVPIFWWFVWKTTIGFEIRTVGANPSAARYAGMSPRRLIILTMSLCGMLAGLAGVILMLGEIGFYPATFGTAIGFDAIAIALLGRSHPVGVMLGSLLFGFMRAGAPLMQVRAGIPIEIIDILTATILFFLAADVVVRHIFRMRGERGLGAADQEQQFTKSYGGGSGDLMDVLFDIPVLGLFVQLLDYLLATLPRIAPGILAGATPIALGAMCGLLCERSGVVNIGIEGMMLTGAFAGFAVGSLTLTMLGDVEGITAFGITVPLLVGVLAAVASGLILATVFAWLTISVRADQIIAGTIVNIAALGLTSYLNRLMGSELNGAGRFKDFKPPEFLSDLPFVGWIIDMFFDQGPIAMSVIIIVIFLQIMLFKSRWGLRTRAVGEHPKAADTVGVDVIKLRYRNVIIAGALAGLAGGYLTLEATGTFQNGMTAGRGFIALAALIFGRWTPVGAFAGALLFAASERLGIAIGLRPPAGELGDFLEMLPNQFWAALPYLITIIILAGVVGRSIPPAAVGRPYEKESST